MALNMLWYVGQAPWKSCILYGPLDITTLLAGNIRGVAYRPGAVGRFADRCVVCIVWSMTTCLKISRISMYIVIIYTVIHELYPFTLLGKCPLEHIFEL